MNTDKKRKLKLAATLFVTALLAGCASPPPKGGRTVTVPPSEMEYSPQ